VCGDERIAKLGDLSDLVQRKQIDPGNQDDDGEKTDRESPED
jgi:hypothetical protein